MANALKMETPREKLSAADFYADKKLQITNSSLSPNRFRRMEK